MRNPKPAHYSAIHHAAHAKGWPKKFRRDLTLHDRLALRDTPIDEPFAWILREHGTHLVFPRRYMQSRGLHEGKRECLITLETIRTQFDPDQLVYWWDGAFLRQTTHERLRELISEDLEAREGARHVD